MLTYERLRELLHYEPNTGVFTWLVVGRGHPSGRVGHISGGTGYLTIRLDRRLYQAHRLAWLWMAGAWPTKDLDHRNGDRLDNRMANLREATMSQNLANSKRRSDNKSGRKGVFWNEQNRKWRACIMQYGRRNYLGCFSDKDEAYKAYAAAAVKYFGEFGRAPCLY